MIGVRGGGLVGARCGGWLGQGVVGGGVVGPGVVYCLVNRGGGVRGGGLVSA